MKPIARILGYEKYNKYTGKKYKKPIPIVECEQEGQQFTFLCPFCGKRHYHGAGEGHRCAHCRTINKISGYILKYNGKIYEKNTYPSKFSKTRQEILKRDHYTCQFCGSRNKSLCVHHINYNKKDNRVENLITLCIPCHAPTISYKNREKWIDFYQRQMNINYSCGNYTSEFFPQWEAKLEYYFFRNKKMVEEVGIKPIIRLKLEGTRNERAVLKLMKEYPELTLDKIAFPLEYPDLRWMFTQALVKTARKLLGNRIKKEMINNGKM